MTHAGRQAFRLAANFFLIILAYYQLKPASRSLLLDYTEAGQLPWLWIGSAALLLGLMPLYQRFLERHDRMRAVVLTMTTVVLALVSVRIWLALDGGLYAAVALFLLVDIISVVLVEQLWSMANASFQTGDARRWYGIIGSGGLLGGLIGGIVTGQLISSGWVQTADLIIISSGLVLVLAAITQRMIVDGCVERPLPQPDKQPAGQTDKPWAALLKQKYLLLVGCLLLFGQLIAPMIDYQFMQLVQERYTEREQRTAYVADIYAIVSGCGVLLNVLLTPILLRLFGAARTLWAQPMLLAALAAMFVQQSSLLMATALKLVDRCLAYSVGRAAKEMLYLPVAPALVFKAKAWLDMVGYRLCKMLGAGLILLVTQDWMASDALLTLAALTIGLCAAWAFNVLILSREYRRQRRQHRCS